jgi:hypothetical protein
MIQIDAILKYDPLPLTGDPDKMFKPWWLVAFIDGEMLDYYSWVLGRETGITLMKPAWGGHISIIRGEVPANPDAWKRYDNEPISLSYVPDIRTNGKHWWLPVICDRMNDIREELGLVRKHDVGLHFTLGQPVPKCMAVSTYFHQVYTAGHSVTPASISL